MKNVFVIPIAGMLLLSVLMIVSFNVSAGDTITVGPGGPPTYDYGTIQEAINAANESDTIYVYSNTYRENIVINKPLTLTGEDRDGAIISGPASNKDTVTVESVSNVNISGFEIIQNPTAQGNNYHSIYINHGDYCSITDCNVKDGNIGIWVKNSDGCTISGNTIEGNNFAGVSISIYSDNNIVFDNAFSQNEKGIYIITDSNSNVIHHNTFQNNDQHAYDECNNQWDDGSEGNYWDDYKDKYPDATNDGHVWDTPYDIPGGSNQDLYPSVNQKPVAVIDSISPNPAVQGQTVNFNGHVVDDGTIIEWEWKSSKDGVFGYSEDITYSSLSLGTHAIKFRAKDDDDQWSEYAEETLVINSQESQDNQKPTATIVKPNIASAIYGETVDFHGYGFPSEGMITEFNWRSSKDGFLSALQTFNKSDLSVGTHTIYFKVKDVNGWSDEASVNLVINPDQSSPNEPPVADAGGPYSGYVNVSLSFDASDSYDPDEENINYSWDFGDGSIGYGITVGHVYTASGTYTVNLTVRDNHGETATNVTSAAIIIQSNGQNGNDGENGTTPGFEILFFMLAVALILLKKNKKKEV